MWMPTALIAWTVLSFYGTEAIWGHVLLFWVFTFHEHCLSMPFSFSVNEAIMKYFTVSLQFLLEFQVCYLNHLARYNYQSASLQRENVLVNILNYICKWMMLNKCPLKAQHFEINCINISYLFFFQFFIQSGLKYLALEEHDYA